ncbi:hypothetical protein [Desulfurobacterium sp.]
MKWWEKTVEYYFVRKYLTDSAIAPLDGKAEFAGDALFVRKGKLVLIEFKRDESSISQEKRKFCNFEEAKRVLQDKDDHHYIIFGAFNKNFTIYAQTYFSNKKMEIEEALKRGVDPEKFNEYLMKLLKFKNKNKNQGGNSGSGSGSIMPENYSIVAVVNSNGNIVSCMSLSEYYEEHLEPKQDKSSSVGYNPEQEPPEDDRNSDIKMDI